MSQAAPPFLSALPVFARFEDVADPARYVPLPDGWSLALADVVSSTQAIAAGKYKMVNMAGAAVITAVLNALGRNDYPFVFGGDGAAVAIPPEGKESVQAALAAVARWILDDLGLQMRTALVPVAAIRAAGRDVQVARFRASPDMAFAMFAGGGSSWAEAAMKAGEFAVPMAPPGTRADLTGLSCRWNPVQARKGVILSIIAVPTPGGDPLAFRTLVADVVAIGNAGDGQGSPLPPEGPRPRLWFGGVASEARAAAPPGQRFRVRLGIIVQIVVSTLLHRLNRSLGGFDARRYGRELAANSDFRKFDDGLKMTLDVDAAGAARIGARLERAAAQGVCRFGLHRQASALVTCIVPSAMGSDHMHFIDGAEGGYAQAAMAMKAMA
ncbi:MAG: DUF3095 domain-containing protein [Gemmobacter sp.]